MKKKVLATLLLSTLVLTHSHSVSIVVANEMDSKIAAQDNKIQQIAAQQADAQAQVDAIQSQVNGILAEQQKLTEENVRLEEESRVLASEIERLSGDIVARDSVLKNQARSAQTDASATSYINTILDSKSIVDSVSRINAMREIVSANNRMLEQQKIDKEVIVEKQMANQAAINTLDANRQKLEDDAQLLQVRQAELQVAQLNLAAEKTTAENEKAALLEQKAAAEEAARQAAAQQAAYLAQQAQLAQQQRQTAIAPAVVAPTEAGSTAESTPAAESTTAPAEQAVVPAASEPTHTSAASKNARFDASSYPVGECTWGVKSQLSWVGPYWGNANQWISSAAAEGFRTGSVPQVGAIAVWTGGAYGHVAVVTAVESSTSIQVSESNYMGRRYIGNHRGGFFNPTATSEGAVYYVYPPY